jgi:hypothetical protein
MISDPQTTPDLRTGRILIALLVAAGTAYFQLGLYRTNGLLRTVPIVSLSTAPRVYLEQNNNGIV